MHVLHSMLLQTLTRRDKRRRKLF